MNKNIKDIYQYALGAVVVIGFFALLGVMLSRPVPAENKEPFNIMLGILSGAVGLVIGYFFGSSKGSSEKNDIIAGNKESKP